MFCFYGFHTISGPWAYFIKDVLKHIGGLPIYITDLSLVLNENMARYAE